MVEADGDCRFDKILQYSKLGSPGRTFSDNRDTCMIANITFSDLVALSATSFSSELLSSVKYLYFYLVI